MYLVYVLLSTTAKRSYVGSTDNIKRRLIEHNSGTGIYTRKYRPWVIVHTEEFPTKEEALKQEKYYKTHAGRKRLKEVIFMKLGSGVIGNTSAFGAEDSRFDP